MMIRTCRELGWCVLLAATCAGCCGSVSVLVQTGTASNNPLARCPGAKIKIRLTTDQYATGTVLDATGAARLEVPGQFSQAFKPVAGAARAFPVAVHAISYGPASLACALTDGVEIPVVVRDQSR